MKYVVDGVQFEGPDEVDFAQRYVLSVEYEKSGLKITGKLNFHLVPTIDTFSQPEVETSLTIQERLVVPDDIMRQQRFRVGSGDLAARIKIVMDRAAVRMHEAWSQRDEQRQLAQEFRYALDEVGNHG